MKMPLYADLARIATLSSGFFSGGIFVTWDLAFFFLRVQPSASYLSPRQICYWQNPTCEHGRTTLMAYVT